MSTKISALASAPDVRNADLLTTVQGGVNFKTTRPTFLSAVAAEVIRLLGTAGAFVQIDSSDNVEIRMIAGQTYNLDTSATTFQSVDASGNHLLQAKTGQTLQVIANGGQLLIDAVGGCSVLSAVGSSIIVSYTPLAAGNWAGSPTDLAAAIDRIAAVVSFGGATPIP